MSIEIKKIDSRSEWDSYISTQQPHTFLHSWEWGEFNVLDGNTIFRLGIYEEQRLIGVCLVILVVARRAKFLFIPHGPICEKNSDKVYRELFQYIRQIGKEHAVDFIRCSPLLADTPMYRELFKKIGFRPAPIHMHPELAWMLDITQPEESLMLAMRKTTRYSIKKAEKDGVTITQSQDINDVDQLYNVYTITAQRQHFAAFSKGYLEHELSALGPADKAVMFFAHYQNDIVATAVIIFSNGSAFYHHGASTQKHSKLTASYLLQWAAIKEARARGCTLYNFWGIAPADKPKHPWAGLSLFKQGFGGYSEAYVPTQDMPLSGRYWLNYGIEYFRRKKRRL